MRISIIIFFILSFSEMLIAQQAINMGAQQPEVYLPLLKGKNVGLVVNHTSKVEDVHLVDFLLNQDVKVEKIFAPEHGFRGDVDAGEEISDQIDQKTGLPVISLYGDNKKPTSAQLQDVDVIVFDIQDVGVRFYTYLSTMHYVMEACAENHIPLIIFDRPNPNGDYVAGPVLKKEFRSFVGMHPIPVVHGCTLGEMANMINGEKWLDQQNVCDLTVIAVKNYTHQTKYSLPIKPSPNLPNDISIRLYPSLCFFEATNISIGRGTTFPFQVVGFPDSSFGEFQFTPLSIPGMATNPKHEGVLCFGEDLRTSALNQTFSLFLFFKYYHIFSNESDFLSSERWLELLSGTDQLLADIRAGKSICEIEESWEEDLKAYRDMRQKYLLYPDEPFVR